MMKNQSGQSLVELIIAMGIIVLVIGSVAFLVIDSYISGRLSKEITQANFLAEEGVEAVRSIRDNSWDDLSPGTYGIIVSGGTWQFQIDPDVTDNKFTRSITVGELDPLDPDRKKIISQVDWKFIENRQQQVQLITYLTNWQKIALYCQGNCIPCSDFLDRKLCIEQDGCSWIAKDKVCTGACNPCENFLDQVSCEAQLGCTWPGL